MFSNEQKSVKKTFPPISECKLSTIKHQSIAADLDGTLLKASLSFPNYILIAIEAGSLLRGLITILTLPFIVIAFIFISEELAAKILIFVTFRGIKVSDIEAVSRSILPRLYSADVRRDSFEVFDSCKRKVVVTANPVVVVETFAKEYLGAGKVIGTEIEVDSRTNRATGFVKEPGVLVGDLKKFAVLKEFGDDNLPDIGLGDRESDYDFMSICKEGYIVPSNRYARIVSPDCLKTQMIFHHEYPVQPANSMINYIWKPLKFVLSPFRAYFNLSLLEEIVKCAYRRRGRWL